MNTPTQVEEYRVQLGSAHYHVVGNATSELAYLPRHDDAVAFSRAVNLYPHFVKFLEDYLDGRSTSECVKRAEDLLLLVKKGI